MPITYVIDAQERLIFEDWTGEVSAADLAEYWRRYLADPEVLAIRRTIVDLRNSTPMFTGTELNALVKSIVQPVLGNRDWITALIVSRPLQMGVSRQYQVFAEQYSVDAIFHEPHEALEWIRGQHSS